MAENKDLNQEVEKLEKIVSKDAVITIAGYSFTPAKLMIVFGIVSSTLGGLYGAFEAYKGYQDMKTKIEKYVAPDLSEFDKRLSMVEETSTKTNDYTRDIKNDIKNDIRRLESVVEQVERSQKQSQRETDQDVRQLRKEIDQKIQKALDNPLAGK
jgi:predicted NodU family carbamoyl transferase